MFHRPVRPPLPAACAKHRFFFALLPPPALARQLADAARWFGDTGRPVAAGRLHITLFILPDFADYPLAVIDRLRAVGAAVMARPIDVVLDHASGGGRSVALRPQRRSAGLTALHREIARRCPEHGIAERPGYVFHPHVTLGYRDGRWFGARVTPVAWTATEFVLIHSHLGHTRHEMLGRWPLIGPVETQLALL